MDINIFDYRDKDGLLISDVDDTILLSYSTKMRKRLRNMFFINPEKRKMIEGASEFLNKVKRMNYGVIYLSNSESNLQPILNRFINTNEFPQAPLLLSRYLYWKDVFDKDIHHYKKTHKIESLLSICEYFEKIPLVLVGDSGQKDLSTYHEIASHYPERVQNILIHELPWKPNTDIIEDYRKKLQKMNITVELFDTSYASINSFGSEE